MSNVTKQQAPLYVFVYDISNNKERGKVDDVLRDYSVELDNSAARLQINFKKEERQWNGLRR